MPSGCRAAWESARRAGRRRGTLASSTASNPAGTSPRNRPEHADPTDGGTPAGPQRSASTLRHLLKDADKRMKRLERRRADLSESLVEAGRDHQRLAEVGADL